MVKSNLMKKELSFAYGSRAGESTTVRKPWPHHRIRKLADHMYIYTQEEQVRERERNRDSSTQK